MIEIAIAAILVLAAALIVALHKAHEERKEKNALYARLMQPSLPAAAQIVALPHCESTEYKLQQALNREAFLRQENARLESENRILAGQKLQLLSENASLRGSYAAIEQDYLRQFAAGRDVVTGMVSLMSENDRLRLRLAEEASARQLAELKLTRFERARAADPCHATS